MRVLIVRPKQTPKSMRHVSTDACRPHETRAQHFIPGPNMIDWWTLSVFAAYFAVLLGIAVIRVRPVRTMSDYVLAGRRLGIFTSAMSVGSSTTSGWTFLALPALAFSNGTVVGWTLLSLVVFHLGQLGSDRQEAEALHHSGGRFPHTS